MGGKNKKPYNCFPLEMEGDGRQISPSSRRNGPHILKILKKVLPREGTVLEVAAGSGEHTVMFAPEFPNLEWLPSDPAANKLESIRAWMKTKPSGNILPPIALDAADLEWPVENRDHSIAAVICINMIHIAPWDAGKGLLAAAGRILPNGGVLYLYGPYKKGGKFTAPSNKAFDETLKRKNPAWGLRDIGVVEAEAGKHGLKLLDVIDMPANNFSLVFQKK